MPISRKHVQTLCTADEFRMYSASLRLSLAAMPPDSLRSCIRWTRKLLDASGPRRKSTGRPPGRKAGPRKEALLAGALSRFEGRLRALETDGLEGKPVLP